MTKTIGRCTYRATWSKEDYQHVGLCTAFPSLSRLKKTPEQALAGICKLVRGAVDGLLEQDDEVPEAIAGTYPSFRGRGV